MKRIRMLALSLAVVLSATLLPAQAITMDEYLLSMEHFTHQRSYPGFVDVEDSDWFAQDVANAYEIGLVNGSSDTTFSPDDTITVAETLALAARINSIYHTGACTIGNTSPWYMGYVQYCNEQNIIHTDSSTDYNRPITRREFASIFASTLPAFLVVNELEDNAIPDVPMSDPAADAIYLLYTAGVLTGNDEKLTFTPDDNIQRSAVATILSRMADQDQRVTLKSIPQPQPSESTTKYDMPADTNGDGQVSQEEMNVVLDALRIEYPQGTPWTNDNYYGPYRGSGPYGGGYGCAGWAFLVTDRIFGNAPQYEITADELQPGDYFWTGSHFGVIIETSAKGFYTTEGNFNSSIYWDYHRSNSFFTANNQYFSRHPQ